MQSPKGKVFVFNLLNIDFFSDEKVKENLNVESFFSPYILSSNETKSEFFELLLQSLHINLSSDKF